MVTFHFSAHKEIVEIVLLIFYCHAFQDIFCINHIYIFIFKILNFPGSFREIYYV